EAKQVRADIELFAAACSGDMYATVPIAMPGLVSCSTELSSSKPDPAGSVAALWRSRASFASPKSRTLIWPRWVTKMLAGFTRLTLESEDVSWVRGKTLRQELQRY